MSARLDRGAILLIGAVVLGGGCRDLTGVGTEHPAVWADTGLGQPDVQVWAPDSGPDAASMDAGSSASEFPWSLESTGPACSNGVDDDDNGYTDCSDFACSRNRAVFTCGFEAQYEASPSRCSDGLDDDGDGLIDCADPDCAKNPFHTVCPAPLGETACGTNGDADGDGLAGCADPDCVMGDFGCDDGGRSRVLFDASMDETSAGGPNSDWLIDAWGPLPVPSAPTEESDWAGALSSFGFELFQDGGYLLQTCTSWGGRVTWGDATNPQDLKGFDVLVVFEPSRKMTSTEKEAIVRFVQQGGGLLAVSNHIGADRDSNGYSAPQVWNDLFDANPVAADPFGLRFDEVDASTAVPLEVVAGASHPVLSGPAGTVERIGFYDGCTAQATGTNPNVTALVELNGEMVVGAAEVGAGRVVVLCDSAIGGDGTDSHGVSNPSHDSWHDASLDNRALLLNAMSWLARR